MTHQLERRDFFKMGLAAGGLTLAGTACGPAADASEASSAPEFTLYHEVYGEGPAVVFAHGAGGTHMSWWHQIPAFSRDFMCVTYSQRGYGLSPDVPHGPGRGAFVDDLRRLLDELEIERAALVGQSMGGRSVLGFAAAYPERVTALVMASTTGGYTDPELDALRASAPDLGQRRAYAASYAERDPEGAFLYQMVSRTNQYLTPAGEEAGGSDAPMPDIARIVEAGVPTLFTVGEQDTVAPPSVTKAMRAKMTGSRLATFPESGHSTYWELPDEFNAMVLDFLRG